MEVSTLNNARMFYNNYSGSTVIRLKSDAGGIAITTELSVSEAVQLANALSEAIHEISDVEMTDDQKRVKQLASFKDYFIGLYGEGLEVANWHQNGETEPFDNFYDSAVQEEENA